MWNAWIFDLDDTLYPERQYVDSGFQEVSHMLAGRLSRDAAQVYSELRQIFASGNHGSTFDEWLDVYLPEGGVMSTELVERYRQHLPTQLALFEDAANLLRRLRDSGCKIGILTDGNGGVQRRKVQALDLAEQVDAIVFTDDFGRENWKPSPVPFRIVLDLLSESPDRAVYIGDNPLKDFRAPKVLGMATVQIWRGHGLYAKRIAPGAEFEADQVVTTLAELAQLNGSISR
jgi:putative hydrolase of the HAD superfamily